MLSHAEPRSALGSCAVLRAELQRKVEMRNCNCNGRLQSKWKIPMKNLRMPNRRTGPSRVSHVSYFQHDKRVFPLVFPRLTLALTAFGIADDLVRDYFEKGFSVPANPMFSCLARPHSKKVCPENRLTRVEIALFDFICNCAFPFRGNSTCIAVCGRTILNGDPSRPPYSTDLLFPAIAVPTLLDNTL